MKLKLLSGFIMTAGLLISAQEAQAIPAFARSHQLPCSICHVGFPKLSSFGKEFEHRGFRLEDQEGKYLWEQPFPIGGKLSFLLHRTSMNWEAPRPTPDLIATTTTAFELFDWQLFSGGTLAPTVSYFFQLVGKIPALTPEASSTSAGHEQHTAESLSHSDSTIRTEALWVQLNDLVSDSRMNLRVGLDHIDNHFLFSPLRLTHADYLIQIQHLLGASLHPNAYGVALNGDLPIGLNYNVGVRNYSTSYIKAGTEMRLGAVYGLFTKQMAQHEASFLVSYDLTGDANAGQDGSTLAYGMSLDLHIGKLNIIPGIFWFQGHAASHMAEDTGGGGGHEHDHDGGESAGIVSGDKLRILSGTIEAIYPFRHNLLGTARFDFNSWSQEAAPLYFSPSGAQQYVASLAWYQYPNVRWVAEYSRLTTQNLMPIGEPGLMELTPTSSEAYLTQDTVLLKLEVDF